ncbi:hypothetical protein V495_07204, partial [Pseudogymnoascus sp. VKM F-4514 (FW-929)]
AYTEDAEAEIEEDYDEGGEHPEIELIPVAPAGANIKGRDDIMRFLEEFHSKAAPNDVGLRYEGLEDGGLRLVKFAFDDGPNQGVEEGLDEDYATSPAVEEVEVLVGDACEEGKDAFSAGEEDAEGG